MRQDCSRDLFVKKMYKTGMVKQWQNKFQVVYSSFGFLIFVRFDLFSTL